MKSNKCDAKVIESYKLRNTFTLALEIPEGYYHNRGFYAIFIDSPDIAVVNIGENESCRFVRRDHMPENILWSISLD